MKLNLGCGKDIKPGFINVDYIKHNGVDVVLNLETIPYPFKSKSVDYIMMSHVLEHLVYPIKTLIYLKSVYSSFDFECAAFYHF